MARLCSPPPRPPPPAGAPPPARTLGQREREATVERLEGELGEAQGEVAELKETRAKQADQILRLKVFARGREGVQIRAWRSVCVWVCFIAHLDRLASALRCPHRTHASAPHRTHASARRLAPPSPRPSQNQLAAADKLLGERRDEILGLRGTLQEEEAALSAMDTELRKSFGREMELRRASHFKRTLGMSHATVKAYETPLPKLPSPSHATAGRGSPSKGGGQQVRGAAQALLLSPARPSTSVDLLPQSPSPQRR